MKKWNQLKKELRDTRGLGLPSLGVNWSAARASAHGLWKALCQCQQVERDVDEGEVGS